MFIVVRERVTQCNITAHWIVYHNQAPWHRRGRGIRLRYTMPICKIPFGPFVGFVDDKKITQTSDEGQIEPWITSQLAIASFLASPSPPSGIGIDQRGHERPNGRSFVSIQP